MTAVDSAIRLGSIAMEGTVDEEIVNKADIRYISGSFGAGIRADEVHARELSENPARSFSSVCLDIRNRPKLWSF